MKDKTLTIHVFMSFSINCTGLYEKSQSDEKFKELFQQDKICELTNQTKEVFSLFLDSFGQALIGHKYFNDQMKSKYNFSKVCTISDEAFGIFTLERCWDSWISEMKRVTNPQETIIKAKHTNEKSNKKFGGWDEKGLQRFSDIARVITITRDLPERVKMEDEYRDSYYNKFNSLHEKKDDDTKTLTRESTYIAYNDLGSDDEICKETIETENCLMGVGGKIVYNEMLSKNMDYYVSSSQDIEYGQNQDYSLKDEGK